MDVIKGPLGRLDTYEVHHVPRTESREEDIMSKLALAVSLTTYPRHVN